MDKLIIYGNGSIARLLLSYISSEYKVCGFTVDDDCIKDDEFCGLPIVPFSEVDFHFKPQEYKMIIAIGFIEMNDLRYQKYFQAKQLGYNFATYIDSSVKLHDNVQVSENCIILDFVSIHPGTHIGHSTFISSNVNIGHDCIISHTNWINSGVSIAGGVTLSNKCFLGINSSLSHGIKVGEQSFIGGNVLLSNNSEPKEVYISDGTMKLSRLNSYSFLKFSELK